MKSNLTIWLLVVASIILLLALGRLDLLAIVAPVSLIVSLVATRRIMSNTGPRRI
jgi:hypothetical protein